jgi:hypothetical protein
MLSSCSSLLVISLGSITVSHLPANCLAKTHSHQLHMIDFFCEMPTIESQLLHGPRDMSDSQRSEEVALRTWNDLSIVS